MIWASVWRKSLPYLALTVASSGSLR
jgi:hypothetical protein